MDIRTGPANAAVTAAAVAARLNLEPRSQAWIATLDSVRPETAEPFPDAGAVAALLGRLGASAEDAAEVARAMPSPERDPELYWLLERSACLLRSFLACRSQPGDPMPPIPPSIGLFPAHLILLTLAAIRDCHRQLRVPDDISRETLSHLGRALAAYRASHGKCGIEIGPWDWLRYTGWLYDVGRLQAMPYRLRTHPKEAGPLFWYDDETAARLGLPFRQADPAIGIHIQPGAPLTPEACDESLRRMRDGLASVYSEKPARIATCTSWLLDEQLAEYLPSDSNIVAFQRRFRLVPGARDDNAAILRFVFGDPNPPDLNSLPQDTALQRVVVSHIQSGRHWRMRTGWLEWNGATAD
jgi:hypothetical protein